MNDFEIQVLKRIDQAEVEPYVIVNSCPFKREACKLMRLYETCKISSGSLHRPARGNNQLTSFSKLSHALASI